MIWHTLARTDWVIGHPAKGNLELDYSRIESLDRWSWCDSLFMAPPVYAKLYAMTGDKKYVDFLNREYRATYDFLFDKEEHLFYRDKHRRFYEDLFVTLSARVAELQSKDGYWHASLLDPESYPSPETSATGFIVYALAYGINEGLLDKDKFTPVVVKGWQAMLDAVSAEGKLGYVQPIGADPRKVTREMTEVYGVGAFLLAGNQIYKMAQ